MRGQSQNSAQPRFALLRAQAGKIGASELAYYELQDKLKHLASLNGAHIGLAAPSSDADLRRGRQ
ncbi:MAG TPA: hypothetical protein VMQ17_13400 [Candidatus Sulfotelmatobacter sp.]|nr:hypothetical protein [Candidatus Sulfotelmatobacter sp.]